LSDRPVLGYLAGAVAAFAIQSSSATIGILQALTVTGKLTFASVYAIIVGIYLGDCVTTGIVCSIGASPDARRTGIIHILYGIGKSALALIGVAILHKTGVLNGIWDARITSGGIANTHTIFNLAAALILLPVCGVFEKISRKIVKDEIKKETEADHVLASLTPALFTSPELALKAVGNALEYMDTVARRNVGRAFDVITDYDEKVIGTINRNEDDLDMLADHISDYLVQLSTYVSPGGETNRLNYYIKCVSEFERIGDLAVNVSENAATKHERDAKFTEGAYHELSVLREATEEVLKRTSAAFCRQDLEEAEHIEPVEEVIDDLIAAMRANHFIRLSNGECSIYTGYIFLDMLTNLERVSDQCANIGIHTISLYLPEAAEGEHEYIHKLHHGEDEKFNSLYASYREQFFDKIHVLKKQG
ncbi:MAG: Na/Pi cotransporter family protein, partial [Lachnospiraceae bacterium]|nr:Na/Pi cotransporter family protein [Lachnospiraceae bacterium]